MNISKNYLLEKFKKVLKNDEVSLDDSFFDLGGDSFDAIRLLHELNLDIKVIDIFKNPSVDSLFEVIEKGDIDHNVLIRLNSDEVATKEIAIVVIPYGGGDVSVYKKFSDLITSIPVYGVDTNKIGTTTDEVFKEAVEELADQIISMGFQEVILYGHCAGSALALYLEKVLNSKIEVKLFLAASVPISYPYNAMLEFQKTTDGEWEDYLHEIGGLNGLNSNEISRMLKKGRHDHIISILSFSCILRDRNKSKATLVFGTCDPVTSNLEKIVEEWEKYISISNVVQIPNAGHYFINDYADIVANTIKLN